MANEMMPTMLALVASLAFSQTPDQHGPHRVSSALEQTFHLPSGDLGGDLFWPEGTSEPAPVVVIGHGFQRSSTPLSGWGEHFASHGMIVAIPNFPGGFRPDHRANGQRLSELIDLIRRDHGPITAKVDPSRSVVVGHSAGGLAALFAAASDPTISLFVGLDPVDTRGGEGLSSAPSITQPTVMIAALPGLCNSQGSAATLWTGIHAGESWFVRVANATHFDAEDPSDRSIIVNGCGGSDETRRTLFRRYATAHILAHFRCQGLDFLPGGANYRADLASGAITDPDEVSPMIPCGSGSDAGITPETPDGSIMVADAGSIDVGGSEPGAPDAGRGDTGGGSRPGADASMPTSRGDAGASTPSSVDSGMNGTQMAQGAEAPGRADSEGCGCTSTRSPRDASALSGMALLLALVTFARRRRS